MSGFIDFLTEIVLVVCFGVEELAVVLISMAPIVELKGGIPVGVRLGLPLDVSFWLSFFGSSLVCIPLLLLLPIVFKIPLFRRVKKVFEKKASRVSLRAKIGMLFLLVAIPVPGTGVWMGSAIAVVLGIGFWRALTVIVLGNLVAGGTVVGLTLLIGKNNLDILLFVLFVMMIILLALFIVKLFTVNNETKDNQTQR